MYRHACFSRNEILTKIAIHLYFSLCWDQTTPFGYFALTSLSTLFAASYSIINGVVVLTFVSLCLHHRAIYEIFRGLVNRLNSKNDNNKEALAKLSSFEFWFEGKTELFDVLQQNIHNFSVAVGFYSQLVFTVSFSSVC